MTPEQIVDDLVQRLRALGLGGLITDESVAEDANIAMAKIAGLIAALAGKADLGPDGKLLPGQVGPLYVTDHLGAVNSQAAMLALTGQRGDWCIRTDRSTVWVLAADDPSKLASWVEWVYPASGVPSVNGRSGPITLTAEDVTDATAVGRSLMKAANAAAARSAIGAGVLLNERGAYSASTAYSAGDVVTRSHGRWYAKADIPAKAWADADWVYLGANIIVAVTQPSDPNQLWIKVPN